ncbi:hypothetical protein U8607_11235 [Methylobacterium durans]|uniref:Uncharacterized protein n=2 Tax=Methylobacterium durans TaxID=2202825 RepID=A0A2U8WEE8_9HYPH|nr:hypothetical protein [Methylobacterium durans]AWN43652.1 hypothetical protein DK389_28010 [Methylobacterium durans]MEA1832654.1 hypothetical protein [Methylobacterium durans]
MKTAKACGTAEQWIELPEPALNRYLLGSRSRAANDNHRLSRETFRTLQIGTCMALTCALCLIVTLVG